MPVWASWLMLAVALCLPLYAVVRFVTSLRAQRRRRAIAEEGEAARRRGLDRLVDGYADPAVRHRRADMTRRNKGDLKLHLNVSDHACPACGSRDRWEGHYVETPTRLVVWCDCGLGEIVIQLTPPA